MNRPYKLRFVNQLVGSFLLLVVMVLLVVVMFAARTQEWFVPHHDVTAHLPEDELDGLARGTPVQILGRRAGEVRQIEYANEGQMLRLTLSISDRYFDQIYADSVVRVKRRLAGAGDAYLEITRGPLHAEPVSPQAVLQVATEPAPSDELRHITEMVGQVRDSVADVRDTMVRTFTQFEQTSLEVSDSNRQLQNVLQDWERFTPRLDPMADEFVESNRQFQQTTSVIRDSNQQLQSVLRDVQEMTPRWKVVTGQAEQLLSTTQEVADTMRDESRDLPGTVSEFRQTVGARRRHRRPAATLALASPRSPARADSENSAHEDQPGNMAVIQSRPRIHLALSLPPACTAGRLSLGRPPRASTGRSTGRSSSRPKRPSRPMPRAKTMMRFSAIAVP